MKFKQTIGPIFGRSFCPVDKLPCMSLEAVVAGEESNNFDQNVVFALRNPPSMYK